MGVRIVFLGRELFQIPLIAVIVIIIHPVIHNGTDLSEGLTISDQLGDLFLHVTEEALLERVIPAGALPRHGLDEGSIPQHMDEGVAGIVTALFSGHPAPDHLSRCSPAFCRPRYNTDP